ncbi:DUF7288 family protein [Natronorubrum sp. FCH18a]|uniref:DUF7288 family protein n=1 Tax=Natronorubrum sp. FCH18a TaxID=3447018 RepID=UPI003F5136CD
MRDTTTPDRGQAYTLEGFIGAMIVLMAILFALQSVVITPTTGGLADRTVEAQVQQETQDALMIAATANESEGNLSKMIRYWDPGDGDDEGEFQHSDDSGHGYYQPSNESAFYDEFVLGEIMVERFTSSGMSYNIELVAQNKSGEFDDENSTYLVYQGESEAVTASYTVTLYEDDRLTAPASDNEKLRDAYESKNYPIPPAHDNDSKVYNVVEVRVSIW